MARSPESLARRRAYTAAWRAARPDYGAMWRRAHPGSERARRLRWKRANREKVEQARRRRAVALRGSIDPLPTLHQGHPLFDQARAIVGPNRSGLTVWLDPLHDDLISVATLAILRGQDAAEEVRRFRAAETAWRRMTCPIVLEVAAA